MRFLRRFFAIFLLLSAAYYGYRAGDLYFRQDKYVYRPVKEWSVTPAAVELSYQDLTLTSADGVRISAWFMPAAEPRGSVIFLHGNARNISADLDAYRMFTGYGFNVIAVDYRGYGKSEGTPDEEGTYRDAQAAWDWLVREKKESADRIVIAGRSLGAAIAADLASKNKPRALILEAGFTSLPEAGQELHPYFPVKLLSRYRYDSLVKIKTISCPVLIVHSRDDELISFEHARRLYEAVPGKKELVVIGGPHKGGYKPTLPIYYEGVRRFLETL